MKVVKVSREGVSGQNTKTGGKELWRTGFRGNCQRDRGAAGESR